MRRRRSVEIITGWVAGDGTLVRSNEPGVSIRRSAAGTYMVSLPSDFRLMALSVTVIGSTASQVGNASNVTANSFQANIFTPNTPALSDVAWSFVAVGV